MRGREQRRQRAALEHRDQHRLLGADRVQHRPHIVDLLLERRRPGVPSDIPVPRRSNTISRENDAIRSKKRAKSGTSHISMFDRNDGTSTTSSGPSPTTW